MTTRRRTMRLNPAERRAALIVVGVVLFVASMLTFAATLVDTTAPVGMFTVAFVLYVLAVVAVLVAGRR